MRRTLKDYAKYLIALFGFALAIHLIIEIGINVNLSTCKYIIYGLSSLGLIMYCTYLLIKILTK